MKLEVRTSTRQTLDLARPEVPTVELIVDGIIFRTDAPNREAGLEIARRVASALVGRTDLEIHIPAELIG